MSTIRSAGITSGIAPGQVDVQALADLIRHKNAELAEVAALFAARIGRDTGGEQRREAQR